MKAGNTYIYHVVSFIFNCGTTVNVYFHLSYLLITVTLLYGKNLLPAVTTMPLKQRKKLV